MRDLLPAARRARRWPGFDEFGRRSVAEGVVSSVVCGVLDGSSAGRLLYGAAGLAGPGRRAGLTTRFDWASLTKPCIATLALRLDREGTLPLALTLRQVWGRGSGVEVRAALRGVRLGDLLRHRSGLPAWWPLELLRRPDRVARFLLEDVPLPAQRRVTYSDLGYILWGFAAERITGLALQDLLRSLVLAPLGMSRTRYWTAGQGVGRHRSSGHEGVARHPLDNRVERRLAEGLGLALPARAAPRPGQPQDGNARFLARPAGHAGLFGPLPDLARLGAEWLWPQGTVLRPADVERAWRGPGAYGLGWARRSVQGSAGTAVSSGSRGHTGFTGGSLWLDRRRGRLYAVLACRTGPEDVNPWRRAFHTIASGISIGVSQTMPASRQTPSKSDQ